MKVLSIYLDGNHIEYHNSLFGMESVYCNGKILSKKFSLFGAEHLFTIGAHVYKIRITNSFAGSYIDLYRDQQAIIESSKNGCIVIFAICVGILFLADYLYSLNHP